MDDICKIVLGGVLAIAGSIVAQIFQAAYAEKKKIKEIVADKRIDACTEAYVMMKRVQSALATGNTLTEASLKKALGFFKKENEEWFLRSRLFLPGRFPDLWIAIRNKLDEVVGVEDLKTVTDARRLLSDLTNEAIDELYHVLGLERIKPEKYKLRKFSPRNAFQRWKPQRSKQSSNDVYKLLDDMDDDQMGTSLVDQLPKENSE